MFEQWCILLFPDVTNRDQIDQYRARFDPLAQKIPPHVTLVFPFVAAKLEGRELALHVAERIKGIGPFDLEASTPAVFDIGYIYLGIKSGAGEIRQLHDSLYTGGLRSFLHADVEYVPHITIGRYEDEGTKVEAHAAAAELSGPFRSRIHEVVIERVGTGGESLVVSRLPL